MRIKSFFSKTVDEAIAQARAELGAEALLLNTRKLAGERENAAEYEVVVGIDEEEAKSSPDTADEVPTAASAAPEEPTRELDRLHARIDELHNLIERSLTPRTAPAPSVPELADLYACLMSAEVDQALCKEIVDRVEASMAANACFERTGHARRLEDLVRAEMTRRVGIDPRLGIEGAEGVVVVLVGPTGAGKTTTVVKLAASCLASDQPVRVVTVDPSPASPLSSLANEFGIPVEPVRSMHVLPEWIAEARKREIVLIDTPGYGGDDWTGLQAVAGVFSKCPDVDIHLVVPGYMRTGDLRRCVRRYEVFQPTKLLVTKLDETQSFGPVFSEAARAGLCLSFLAHGPALPHDIRPASAEDLTALAFDRQDAPAQSVA